MAHFPSNIPLLGGDSGLVDFDQLSPRSVREPSGARLRAWARLAEVERRIDLFDWLVHVLGSQSRQRVVGDFATAYVMSFESCIQILKHEFKPKPDFDSWLKAQPRYDLAFRGIQTMRNLEAHIRSGQLAARPGETAPSRFAAGVDPTRAVPWRFAPIAKSEYDLLYARGRKLSEAELPAWNAMVESEFATEIMGAGVASLTAIMGTAESEHV